MIVTLFRRIPVLCVLAATLAACGDASTQPNSEAADERGGPAGMAGLPAIALEDRAIVLLATQELTSRCMADQGFDYPAVAPTVDELREAEQELAQEAARAIQWYGSDDVEAAARTGYGHADRFENPAPVGSLADEPAPVDRLSPSEQVAYAEALHGDVTKRVYIELPFGPANISFSTSGCIWEANEALYLDVVAFHEASIAAGEPRLRYEVMQRVEADPTYQAALAAWRGCMARSGHTYESPGHARSQIEELFWHDEVDLPAARASEVEVAVADATCARQTGLTDTARKLEDRYTPEVAADMEADVLAFTELHAAVADRAREVLGLD